MDYHRIYREFIADRKQRQAEVSGYSEKHHIVPRSLGGSNSPDNIVRLTAGDHFFAHLLLAKCHGGAMWYALNSLVGGKAIGQRTADRAFVRRARHYYERIKVSFGETHSERMKGRLTGSAHPMFGKPVPPVALEKLLDRIAAGFNPMQSAEARAKVGAAHKGKVVSAETRAKQSAYRKGVPLSAEVRANMSAGHKGKKINPDTVAKIAAANRGKKRTPEQIEAMRKRLTGRKLSPEHVAKLKPHLAKNIARFRGRKHTPESRARMAAICQARREYAAKFGGNMRTLTVETMRQSGIAI